MRPTTRSGENNDAFYLCSRRDRIAVVRTLNVVLNCPQDSPRRRRRRRPFSSGQVARSPEKPAGAERGPEGARRGREAAGDVQGQEDQG